MDPITLAARRFMAEIDAFWKEAPARSVLRLVSDKSHLRDLQKTLRLRELDPNCRRPLALYEASFENAGAYFAGLARQVADDYEAVRAGAAEEGVDLPALAPSVMAENADAASRAAAVVAEVDRLLSTRLEGLDVAFVPAQLHDAAGFRDAVKRFSEVCRAEHLRLSAYDAPDGALAPVFPGVAHFEVDRAELARYLKEMGPKPSAGPKVETPTLPIAKKKELEAKLGRRIPSSDTGRLLRVLLLEASEALEAGHPATAAKRFRSARTLCRLDGLTQAQIPILVAVGTAELAAGDMQAAHAAYGEATELALAEGEAVLVVQARLGTAGAFFAEGRFAEAAVHYEELAGGTDVDVPPPLVVDAWRMAGVCHAARNAKVEAERAWRTALEYGATLAGDLRALTTFTQTADALGAALRADGRVADAAELDGWVAEVDARKEPDGAAVSGEIG